MLKDVYVAFNAEGEPHRRPLTVKWFTNRVSVVIITSNPVVNAELMEGCKENGMHSSAPLWDS